jgi:prepilin-type N-terminal cleavage/methylation domain-containing protein
MKNLTISPKQQSGFTLVEIAIVLVIIGLLLGGVLQGQQLIENSRVRSAMNSLDGVAAGTFSYQDRYGRLPGDDGLTAAINARGGPWAALTGMTGGNINGLIDGAVALTFTPVATSETALFFQHLMAAGFIAGDSALTAVQALPANPWGGLIGVNSSLVMPAGAGGMPGNKVCMSQVPGFAGTAMDTQLDDGSADTGRFRATLGVVAVHTAPGVAATAYAEDQIYTVCYRM